MLRMLIEPIKHRIVFFLVRDRKEFIKIGFNGIDRVYEQINSSIGNNQTGVELGIKYQRIKGRQ